MNLPVDEIERLYTIGGLLLVLVVGVIAVLLGLIVLVWRRQPPVPVQADIPGRLIDLLDATTNHMNENATAISMVTAELAKQRLLSEQAWQRSEAAWARIKEFDAGHQRDMSDINKTQRDLVGRLAGVDETISATATAHESSVRARHEATLASIDATRTSILQALSPMAAQIAALAQTVSGIESNVSNDTRAQLDEVRASLQRLTSGIQQLEDAVKHLPEEKRATENGTHETTKQPGILVGAAGDSGGAAVGAGGNPAGDGAGAAGGAGDEHTASGAG